jgi:RHS repeat-associated protein
MKFIINALEKTSVRVIGVFLGYVLLIGMGSNAYSSTTVTRTTIYEYDANGYLTKEAVEPDDSNLCLVNVYGYDVYGNKVSTTTRNCNGASGESASPTGLALVDARVNASSYSAVVGSTAPIGRFPTQVTNAVGQSQTYEYDARFGKPTKAVDLNGLTTTRVYDDLGRVVRETHADGTYILTEYIYCSGYNGGAGSCPIFSTSDAYDPAVYLIRTNQFSSSGRKISASVTAFYDALNRVIRTVADSENSSNFVLQDTKYNTLGQLVGSSRPYYSSAPAGAIVSSSSVGWTGYLYDASSRVIQETKPSGLITQTTFSGLNTTVTLVNPGDGRNAQSKKTSKNGLGQVVSVTDAYGKSIFYEYDPQGNLTTTTDPLGNKTIISYNRRGQKTQQIDPDMGTWTYTNDVLGQLRQQTDARSISTLFSYDKLGRMLNRSEPDLISTWSYDSCTMGAGKLCSTAGGNGYAQTINYDSLGRVLNTSTTIDEVYTTSYTYGENGQVSRVTYPKGLILDYAYSSTGRMSSIAQATDGPDADITIWGNPGYTADGQIATAQLGDTRFGYLAAWSMFDQLSGKIILSNADWIEAETGDDDDVFGLYSHYQYDRMGNLSSRIHTPTSSQSVQENYTYDDLNRLTQIAGTGLVTRNYAYDDIGNISYKSGFGYYNYPTQGSGSVRPHAVSSITGGVSNTNASYQYDANGNLKNIAYANGNVRNITYSSFNLPTVMTGTQGGANYTYQYVYGPDHQRVKRIETRPDGTDTTIYLNPDNSGGLFFEKEVRADGVTEYKNYITAAGGVIGVFVQESTGSQMRYYHKDYQGSVIAITSGQSVLESLSYEAFGERRYPNGTAQDRDSPIIGITTSRGYTGHEHLDEFNLIHMNGRIYDPALSRFLTPDPNVFEAESTQGFNRYSYVMNNPMNMTDPTGFDAEGENYGTAENYFTSFGGGYGSSSNSCTYYSINSSPSALLQPFSVSDSNSFGVPATNATSNSTSAKIITAADARQSIIAGAVNFFGDPIISLTERQLNYFSNMLNGGQLSHDIDFGDVHFMEPRSQLYAEGGAAFPEAVLTILPGVATNSGRAFKEGEDLIHFEKHGQEIATMLGEKNTYTLKQYVSDANSVIRNGKFVPELNGYVSIAGGQGGAKGLFVGLDRATGEITTMHLKPISFFEQKAPSLGWSSQSKTGLTDLIGPKPEFGWRLPYHYAGE